MSGVNQEPEKFIVTLEGLDMQVGTHFTNKEPWQFSLMQEFGSLKEAFSMLQQFDDAYYDRKLVREHDLPRFIQSAGIFDKECALLLMKRFTWLTHSPSAAGGIYLELSPDKISPQQLQKETGMILPEKEHSGPRMDFYLIVPATTLREGMQQKEQGTIHRRHSQQPRDVGPDKDKGISR